MLDVLADPHFQPFAIALGFMFGLLALEVALMLMGLSSQFTEADMDIDVDADIDMADVTAAVDGLDTADLADIEPLGLDGELDADVSSDVSATGFQDALEALGITKVPSAVWLAGLAAFIGSLGFALQGLVSTLDIGFLNPTLAFAIVVVPAIYLTSKFAAFVGNLIPGVETSAISDQAFHRRRGVVSGGTSEAMRPAEVKWIDGYGNPHYLMAEPLDQKTKIMEGSDVLIVRTKDKKARIINISV